MVQVYTVREKQRSVYLRGQFVGEIPEESWLRIAAEVRANPQIWRAQRRNLVRTLSRALGFGFISVPLGVFWSAFILALFGHPIALGTHVGELLTHPSLVLPGIVLAIAAMSAIGLKLGYVNFFAKARSALVKAHLDIEDLGDVSIR